MVSKKAQQQIGHPFLTFQSLSALQKISTWQREFKKFDEIEMVDREQLSQVSGT
jgi:hypothetical protein